MWRALHATEDQPLARLRDCFGMYDNALPARVMKNLRDFMETKPKNISFSEDNGYPIPTGASLWPVSNVPGMWTWTNVEMRVEAGAVEIFPAVGQRDTEDYLNQRGT